MKKLIIVRHGSYCDRSGCLDENGLAQMQVIAPKIAEHISGNKALILHSNDPRVLMTTEELNKQLKIESEPHDVLASSNGLLDMTRTLEFVHRHGRKRADVLILVTHLEYGMYLAPHLGQQLRSLDGAGSNGLEKDHVLIIDW